MKVLVTYLSRTGNTRKVAEAIFDDIQGDKEIKELDKVETLEGYDLTFIGFPIEAYSAAKPAGDFLLKQAAGHKIALFITHASPEDSPNLSPWLDSCKALAAQAKVVSVFNCQGELSEQIADFMKNSKDERLIAWAKDRQITIGQPDATRLERARSWAREVLAKNR